MDTKHEQKGQPLSGYDQSESEVRDGKELKEDMVGKDEAFEIITAELDLVTKDFTHYINANNKAIFNKYYRVANKTRDSLIGSAYEYAIANGFPFEIMIPVVDKIASNKAYDFDCEQMMNWFGYKVAAPVARVEIYDKDRTDLAPYGYEYSSDYETGSPVGKSDLDDSINGYEGELIIQGDFAHDLIDEDLADKLNVEEYDWFAVVPENDDGEGWGQIFGIKKNDKLASLPMREEQVDEAAQTGLGIEIDRDTQDDDDVSEEFRLQKDRGMSRHKDKPDQFDKMVSLL